MHTSTIVHPHSVSKSKWRRSLVHFKFLGLNWCLTTQQVQRFFSGSVLDWKRGDTKNVQTTNWIFRETVNTEGKLPIFSPGGSSPRFYYWVIPPNLKQNGVGITTWLLRYFPLILRALNIRLRPYQTAGKWIFGVSDWDRIRQKAKRSSLRFCHHCIVPSK